MTKRQKRMFAVGLVVAGVGVAVALGLVAFRKNLMGFYQPSDLIAGAARPGAAVQLGGLVKKGSLQHGAGLLIEFDMADCTNAVHVRYDGVVPDLFREGQGAIATGTYDSNQVFTATQILAKHDENYMPPNMAKSGQGPDMAHACAQFKSVVASP
jgi:cytochrome c-type biogenesis protein CcmE